MFVKENPDRKKKKKKRGKYVNFSYSIILLRSDGHISSPVRYSCLPILLEDNADTFTASLLILYCSFSSLILASIVMINFYFLSKRFFLKRIELSDARVVSMTKKKKIWFCSTLYKDS